MSSSNYNNSRGVSAIETLYNGCRFRSRLEARWAVFFDALKVRYEYEREGYHLASGNYLPDLWLSDLECWVEIKPCYPEDREKELCVELSEMTGYSSLILVGTPGSEHLLVYSAYTDDSGGGEHWWEKGMICGYECFPPHLCLRDGELSICMADVDYSLWRPGFKDFSKMRAVHCGNEDRGLEEAYDAARSARFGSGGKW